MQMVFVILTHPEEKNMNLDIYVTYKPDIC